MAFPLVSQLYRGVEYDRSSFNPFFFPRKLFLFFAEIDEVSLLNVVHVQQLLSQAQQMLDCFKQLYGELNNYNYLPIIWVAAQRDHYQTFTLTLCPYCITSSHSHKYTITPSHITHPSHPHITYTHQTLMYHLHTNNITFPSHAIPHNYTITHLSYIITPSHPHCPPTWHMPSPREHSKTHQPQLSE